jgi:hypothetical protein
MSTPAQISANIANAKSSTGPRTETGKSTSAKNGITLGLFTATDFIRPSEHEAYAELQAQLNRDLAPIGVLETTLVDEIRRATWKLRRCAQVEANLASSSEDTTPDPLESDDTRTEKIQRSLDRARAQAHRLLHKCTAELRRLQTDRHYAQELFFEGADTSDIGIADWRAVTKAHGERTRVELRQKKLDKLHTTLAMVQRVAGEAGRNMQTTMQTQYEATEAKNAA